jgi:cytoskeletal protein CcmA (bactofilin family)
MASEEPGVVGRGITIRGNLSGGEPLVVKGVIEGAISLDNHLTVDSTGKVLADIDVHGATLSGELQGNVNAKEVVAIQAGSHVVGDIVAARVVIEEGAVFKGRIDMDFELPEGA